MEGRNLKWREDWGVKEEQNRVQEETRVGGKRSTEGLEIEQRCVAMGDGDLWLVTKKSQMPGKEV